MPWLVPVATTLMSAGGRYLAAKESAKGNKPQPTDYGAGIPAPTQIPQSSMPTYNGNLGAPANSWSGNQMQIPGLAQFLSQQQGQGMPGGLLGMLSGAHQPGAFPPQQGAGEMPRSPSARDGAPQGMSKALGTMNPALMALFSKQGMSGWRPQQQ